MVYTLEEKVIDKANVTFIVRFTFKTREEALAKLTEYPSYKLGEYEEVKKVGDTTLSYVTPNYKPEVVEKKETKKSKKK